MLVRGVVNAFLLLLAVPGVVLFCYAVIVALGQLPVPRGRVWGTREPMSRWRFALYFGALGLSYALTINLAASEWHGPHLLATVLGPAMVSVALAAGWVVMAVRANRSGT